MPVNFQNIIEASRRIKKYIHTTPVLTSRQLDSIVNANLFLKCENLQKTGSFKIRGAVNAAMSLSSEDASKGIATHSSGNFAAALAQSARWLKINAYVVMPENAPQAKIDAVRGYGAQITFCEPTLEARERELNKIVEKTGATFLHPYDNYDIIAGQGTAAKELCEDIQDLDYVICPVGGGGLLSGTSISVKHLSPETKIIAAEPKGADDAYRSLNAGHIIPSIKPNTIADGLLTSLGERNFPIIQENVDEIITVKESSIIKAMRLVWTRMKIIIEPSSAVTLAVILENPEKFTGKRIGLIISGGNIDLDKLPW